MEFLYYGFFWKALLAGTAIGVSSGPVGLFLIFRRDSLLSHALTHVAFTGVTLGLFLEVAPVSLALLVSVVAAFLVMEIRERARIYEDTAVGILASIGLAAGVLLASLAKSYDVRLLSYLFGNIMVIETAEAWGCGIILLASLFTLLKWGESLFFVSFDEETARTQGLPVKRLKLLLSLLVATIVVFGMKVVGFLLISSLMVVPGAAALELATSLRKSFFLAAVFGGISVIGGLFASALLNLPPSGAIVVFSGALFLMASLLRRLRGE